ncbi:hypothetical protein AARAC_002701 [Aspergillus arachidicola]|uniref:Glucose-methanol-choline oxidoreductase N-terminal domain-containing protein n=1 Tax=Aspergillus arachidicola TaxID=656916 RepID=A0A2G7EMM5_9EURO|nr:hypothetical protein AARAC_002701 [Aspergillus arachidicola]
MITMYLYEHDWTNIAVLTGDTSWELQNMRRYFERLERCEYLPHGTPGHGFTGWLGTNRADLKLALGDFKILSIITAATTAMGHKIFGLIPDSVSQLLGLLFRDLNSADPQRDMTESIYQLPLATSHGKRNGPREYLVDTAKKYPLDIKTGCLATRVLFDLNFAVGAAPKASGVEFLEGRSLYRADPRSIPSESGIRRHVRVSREVILAAGAFGTPQLLKLSGIGPKDELQKFGISVVKDMQGVGTNLQDRYEIPIVSRLSGDFTHCTFGKTGDPCLEDWDQQRGPYLSNGLPVGMVKKSTKSDADPNLFIFGGPALFRGYYPGYSELTTADKRHFTWAVLKAHTHNQDGTVRLLLADPRDVPDIDFNYFTTSPDEAENAERDLDAITEGFFFARCIMDDVLPSITGLVEEESPGRHFASADQVKDYIKNEAWGHHAWCSCPIGADGDSKAVLDSRFRVRGVSNLRVVDASIFPRILGFFIVLPIYMASEKATDVILEDNGEEE